MSNTPDLVAIEGGLAQAIALSDRQKKPYGGGSGGGGDMEARLKHLESDVAELKTDMKAVRDNVAELKGKVSMLPGYGGIALVVGLIVAASTVVQILARFFPAITQ